MSKRTAWIVALVALVAAGVSYYSSQQSAPLPTMNPGVNARTEDDKERL